MKGVKGDGAKHNQMKGASTAGETGPLFPRLHVNETEKAGPRAPPRNKMALYEQFTVPSHRFVQPGRTSGTTAYQQQQYGSNEYRYPYLSYYMPPSVPYANTNHGIHVYAQPSYGISNGGMSSGSAVVNDEESQRVPRPQTVEKSASGFSRAVTNGGGGSSLRSIPEQKAKDATDLHVPTLSSCKVHKKESQKMFYMMPGGPQKHHDKFDSVKSVGGLVRPSITDITDSLQEALSTVEAELECPVSGSQSNGPPRVKKSAEVNGSTYVTDEGQPKQATQQSAGEALDEQNESGGSLMLPRQSCQQSVSTVAGCQPVSRVVCQTLPSHANGTAEVDTSSEYQASGEFVIFTGEEQSSSPSANLPVSDSQSTFTSDDNPGTIYLHKDTQKSCSPTDGDKEDVNAGGFAADNLVKSMGESSGESENNQNGNCGVSEPSQGGTRKGGGSDDSALSVVVSVSMPTMRPKDVIRAVGQQQFWKARKALLRQQRIFSDQVFQLHKLIKVQQLLAETPGTLIDEEMHFGATEDCDAVASHCNLPETVNYSGEKAHNRGSSFKEESKDQPLEAGAQGGITSCNPGWPQAVGSDGVGSNPSMPAFSPGGVSAWGYPSLGAGQWMGSMAAQGRPFVYQPFAGTFQPGSAFDGLYGSAMPISPMIPFGIPYCDQRLELLAEMRSNYGPAAVSNHQGYPAVNQNPSHMPNDLSGSWYFMQYNHLNYNQRVHATGSGKDVPTCSGASVNNQCAATAHSMKTSHVPGIQYQWGMNSHTGPSNTNGLDSSVHQSENSSPSIATRLNCNAFASMPSTSASRKSGHSHQDEEGLAQNLDLVGAYRSRTVNHCENGRRSAREEEADTRTLTRSKGQKEGGQESVSSGLLEEEMDAEHSPDYTGNALDLFPLAPSLSPDGWSGAKPARKAEEWQGRVIKAVPRPAVAASQSAAGILLSLQRERQQ